MCSSDLVMYVRLNEWKKNWFSLYAQAATVLQNELEVAQHWGGLGKGELVSAYSGMYTPEYTITLFRRIHAGTIDWRASLRNTKLNALYRTAFIYCMMYVSPEHVRLFVGANCLQYRYLHRSVHFPGEMSRKDALDRFKMIGFDRVFEDSVGCTNTSSLPKIPPPSRGWSRRRRGTCGTFSRALSRSPVMERRICKIWAFEGSFFFAGHTLDGEDNL